MKSYMERVLLKTTIPKQTADELQRLGSEKYVSVTEVLRRAVAIYAVCETKTPAFMPGMNRA